MSTTPLQPLSPITSATKPISITARPAEAQDESFWGKDGFSFGDLVDLINPLQHIPVVSTIYRAITGDTQSTGAQVLGGALFGGVAGLLVSFVDASIAQNGGQSIAERAIAALTPGESAGSDTQLAQASPDTVRVKDPVEVAELPADIPPFVPQENVASAVPDDVMLPENLPSKADLIPPRLPDTASSVNRAQVQDAIDKYLAATAHIEEDTAKDRSAAIAADLLL